MPQGGLSILKNGLSATCHLIEMEDSDQRSMGVEKGQNWFYFGVLDYFKDGKWL